MRKITTIRYRGLLVLLFAMFPMGTRLVAQATCKDATPKSLTIRYDALEDCLTAPQPLEIEHRGQVVIDLLNVNPYLYDVTITEIQDDEINQEKLNETSETFIAKPMSLDLGNLQRESLLPFIDLAKAYEVHVSKDDVELLQLQYDMLGSEYKADSTELENVTVKYNKIHEAEVKRKNLWIGKTVADQTIIDQEQEIERLKNEYGTDETQLGKNKSTLQDLCKKKKTEIFEVKKNLTNAKQSYEKMQASEKGNEESLEKFNAAVLSFDSSTCSLVKLKDYYTVLYSNLQRFAKKEEIITKNRKASLEYIGIETTNSLELLNYCTQQRRSVAGKFSATKKIYNSLSEKAKDRAKAAMDEATKINDKINDSNWAGFFAELTKLIEAPNEAKFTSHYETLIISSQTDVITYKIAGNPKGDLQYSAGVKPFARVFQVRVKKGLKIDVSPGLFFHIGLKDYQYRFKPTLDDSAVVVEDKPKGAFIPAVGLMLNIYSRGGENMVRPGLNVGVSTNGENLFYYLGGAIMLGNSQRVNICGGIVGGQVSRIRSDYSTGVKYSLEGLPDEVPLQKPAPFQLGGYFGFSFNLTGTKNSKAIAKLGLL